MNVSMLIKEKSHPIWTIRKAYITYKSYKLQQLPFFLLILIISFSIHWSSSFRTHSINSSLGRSSDINLSGLLSTPQASSCCRLVCGRFLVCMCQEKMTAVRVSRSACHMFLVSHRKRLTGRVFQETPFPNKQRCLTRHNMHSRTVRTLLSQGCCVDKNRPTMTNMFGGFLRDLISNLFCTVSCRCQSSVNGILEETTPMLIIIIKGRFVCPLVGKTWVWNQHSYSLVGKHSRVWAFNWKDM